MRRFGTQGRVYPEDNYVVPRTAEVADFINRIKDGKYIVLFAPRQTGKTTFFRLALDVLEAEAPTYFPIQLNFEVYEDSSVSGFYRHLSKMICAEIEKGFEKRGSVPSPALAQFLQSTTLTDHVSMFDFFAHLGTLLRYEGGAGKIVFLIDEFDAIPRSALRGFLRTLRHIYLSDAPHCPHSVGIVGVKSIAQLDYDRSISPFNIQDEFRLPNFTFGQVRELIGQYTDEVGQPFAPEVIAALHKQTAGQPFLVNRLAQLLTEEMHIPKTEPITTARFEKAYTHLLEEDNPNLTHLITNIHKDRHFEALLMDILTYEEGVRFNPRNPLINQLATYGVITRGSDGLCEIANPIYLYCILQAFKPAINGLERDYFPEDNTTGFKAYLTSTGHIDMPALLDNFRDFIARAGFKILQLPETPQEHVGKHLLLTYLELFVQLIGGGLYIEVQTGRGKMDLLITHNQQKYIVETKIWRGEHRYRAGKKQLSAYLTLESADAGYYVVFDHRRGPESRTETEIIDGVKIRSYVIPVTQAQPSTAS